MTLLVALEGQVQGLAMTHPEYVTYEDRADG